MEEKPHITCLQIFLFCGWRSYTGNNDDYNDNYDYNDNDDEDDDDDDNDEDDYDNNDDEDDDDDTMMMTVLQEVKCPQLEWERAGKIEKHVESQLDVEMTAKMAMMMMMMVVHMKMMVVGQF